MYTTKDSKLYGMSRGFLCQERYKVKA